jgi:ATP/maltotriose-dependent transcriptional regulator MalT/DNA-binding SARP family transcriptional activator
MATKKQAEPNTILRRVPASRLAPPALPKGFVSREDLLDQLEPFPVVLVVAPGGFGKTSLLSELAQGAANPYWYSVRGDDSDPSHLAYGVGLALSKGLPEQTWTEVEEVLPSIKPDAGASLLCSLLEQVNDGWVLIIDDLHLIAPDSPSVAMLDAMLRDAPIAAGRVVLAGRSVPELASLSGFRASGLLGEIDSSRLGFDEAKAALALETQELSNDEVGELVRLCAGWPALLRLAGSYLGSLSSEERTEALASLGGSHGALYDYIATQLFEEVPPDLREVLMKTSFCESLTAQLGEAVVGRPVSDALRRAEKSSWLLRTQTAEGSTFTYHPLIADFLQAKAEAEFGKQAVDEFLCAAAEWLARKQQWDEAFRYWKRSGHEARIVKQLNIWDEASVDWWAIHGRWLNEVSEEELHCAPKLLLWKVLGFLFNGNTAEAFRWQDLAEKVIDRSGDKASHVDARINRASLCYFVHELDKADAMFREIEADERSLSPRQKLSLYGGFVLIELDRCEDFDRGLHYLDLIDDIAKELNNVRSQGIAIANRVLLHRLRGDFDAVRRTVRESTRDDTLRLMPKTYEAMAKGVPFVDLGLDEGEPHLLECIRLTDLAGYNWLGASVKMILAIFYTEKGRLEEAQAMIDRASTTPTTHKGVAIGLDIARGLLAAKKGETALARRILGQVQRLSFLATGSFDSTTCEALLLLGDGRQAAELAEQSAQEGRRRGMNYSEACCLYMLAAATETTGDTLRRLFHLTKQMGYEPLFLSRWPHHAPKVLTQALAHNIEPDYALRLLRQLGRHTLRVQTFGGLRVWLDDEELTDQAWERPRSKALFAYFLLQDERATHAELIGEMFWSDQDISGAKNSLRVAATRIRKAIERGEKRLIFEGEHYRLQLGDGAWQDRVGFERLVEAGLIEDDPCKASILLREALSLSAEEFLPEYRYEEWAAEERERLDAIKRKARLRLCKHLLTLRQADIALDFSTAALTVDPLDETAVRMQIRVLSALERQDEARRVFLKLEKDLAEQLHSRPTDATLRLAREALGTP